MLIVLAQDGWFADLGPIRDTARPSLVSLRITPVRTDIDFAAYAVGKDPGRAALYSALLPGGGQFYNGHWWKGLAIGGLEVFLGIEVGTRYLDYRDSPSDASFGSVLNYGFFLLGAWGFSMADAYAFAHMNNFAHRDSLVEKEVEPPPPQPQNKVEGK